MPFDIRTTIVGLNMQLRWPIVPPDVGYIPPWNSRIFAPPEWVIYCLGTHRSNQHKVCVLIQGYIYIYIYYIYIYILFVFLLGKTSEYSTNSEALAVAV